MTFSPLSVAEPVTDGVKDSGMLDGGLYHTLDVRSRHYEYPIMSEHHVGTHLSRVITGVTTSKPVSIVPGSSYNRMDATDTTETVHSAVAMHSKAGAENGLPLVPHSGKVTADSEVASHADRIREYQEELLIRQTDRPHALLEARKRLQMRAEQLLNSGLNLVSESQSNAHHSQSLTVPCDKLDLHEIESYSASRLSSNDLSQSKSSDVLQTEVVIAKPYRPELYQPKSLSEDVESFEYNAAVAGLDGEDDADDDRQFVTPELREGNRVRPCRVAEYSPSPSPHANDAAYKREQLQLSTLSSRSNVQTTQDDFSSLILQARRDLEVRQQQMQDQLEALENEERTLAEQQLQISSQLGSFPSKIQKLVGSEQQTTVLDPCSSSSSDLLAVVVTPCVSAQSTPIVSRNDTDYVAASKDYLDMSPSALRSDMTDRMTVDNNPSPQVESHQIHLSHSAPLLQNQDSSTIYDTSDQLPHSEQSPVSIIFGHCLKDMPNFHCSLDGTM